MLISKMAKEKWNTRNKKYYQEKGYIFTKYKDEFYVAIEDLTKGSRAELIVECDYCQKEIITDFQRYKNSIKTIDKVCCGDVNCMKRKREEILLFRYGVKNTVHIPNVLDKMKETCLERYGETSTCSIARNSFKEQYGVDNPFQLEEVKEKIKETCLEKYGVENYVQTEEYKQQVKQTCLEKYGVDNVSKNEEIKQKIKNIQQEKYGCWYSQTKEYKDRYKNTCQEKYGVDNVFQLEEIKEKIVEYNLDTYGVSHPMKINSIAKDRIIKGNQTKYKLGKGQSSSQQDYLYNMLGGELNYPVDNCLLDIAFLNEKIYIECDFSGHDLAIKMGDLTQEQFNLKEIRRNNFLESRGWKRIRIISTKDLLPSEIKIRQVVDYCKMYLNEHHWINIDIDNLKLSCSKGDVRYDFGELIKINKKYLESIKGIV